MLSTAEIKKRIKEQIHQIKISEFVSDGGWPMLDQIDIVVFDHIIKEDKEIVKLHILYPLERAGCCFIPGREEMMRLPKKVIIKKNQLKFESYESTEH